MNVKAIFGIAIAALLFTVSDQAGAAGETATAEIKLADGGIAGTVAMTELAAGVLLKLDLKGLPPGAHGFHVHETGKCEGDFTSAGAIYNPLGAKHGFINEEGPMAGDLPNVVAAPDGTARAEIITPYLHLNKDTDDTLFDPDGSALVIYEKADDYQTDPEGGGDKRIGCGVIKSP
ncbi:MAG: superoxide dismutase family protein [Hyphomicrobium sp.]